MHHCLKTWPLYFQTVVSGAKTFELRRNDRNFQLGDILILQEFDPETGQYTGKELKCIVTAFFDDLPEGLEEGFCLMSIREFEDY